MKNSYFSQLYYAKDTRLVFNNSLHVIRFETMTDSLSYFCIVNLEYNAQPGISGRVLSVVIGN
jgi:hypothetical protein